nr:MAG TPA_asm: hypothetical protein [Caudoviricetes sp.]
MLYINPLYPLNVILRKKLQFIKYFYQCNRILITCVTVT